VSRSASGEFVHSLSLEDGWVPCPCGWRVRDEADAPALSLDEFKHKFGIDEEQGDE